jgi:fatty-acyl-CoA synthase
MVNPSSAKPASGAHPHSSRLTLRGLLDARVTSSGSGLAFVDGERQFTREQFRIMVQGIATWLRSRDVHRGERVAAWLVNSAEWLALYFALGELGATLVPVNTRYRSEEVGYILTRSGATRLILQRKFRSIDFEAVLAAVDTEKLRDLREIWLLGELDAVPATLAGVQALKFGTGASKYTEDEDGRPEDLSILFTTSGTTSGPKLVMHPQRTIADHALRSAVYYGLDAPGASLLAALPFCGTFGLCSALAAFAGGAPVYVLDAFDASVAAKLLRKHRITHMFGSDDMYQRIIGESQEPNPFPDARVFGFGAFNSSAADFATRTAEKGVPLVGLYGSSELLALFSMQPLSLPVSSRIQAGGLPVAGAESSVRVRDTATGELVGAWTPGELEIRGPCNFIGYFGDAGSTSQVLLADGYFRTGDLGHLRDDGTFVFETRMGDAIRIGGFLVNPLEIEDMLKRIVGVADAQVVAVEIDSQSRPVAFICPEAGSNVTPAGITAAAQGSVAAFKVPARIWFVSEYPVTASANGVKTQRNKLRDMARYRLDAETSGRAVRPFAKAAASGTPG